MTDSYPDWPFYDSGLLDELFVQLGSVTLAGGQAASTTVDHEGMAGFLATLIACEG